MKRFLRLTYKTLKGSYKYFLSLDKELKWFLISSIATIILVSSSSLYLSIACRSWLPAFWFPLMSLGYNLPGLLVDNLKDKYNMKKFIIVEMVLILIDIPLILLNEFGFKLILYLVGIIDIILVFNNVMLGVILTREIENRKLKVEKWKSKTSAIYSLAGILSSLITLIITLLPNWYIVVIAFIILSLLINYKYYKVLK